LVRFTNVFNIGLYDANKAQNPIKGFNYQENRDFEEGQVDSHSQWGTPTCKDWWSDPENGLEVRLKQAVPPDLMQSLLHLGGNNDQLQEAAIKTLITHSFTLNQSMSDQLRGYESLNDNASGDYFSRFVGAQLGVAYESFSFYPKLHLLINALPVIQSALLFAIYAFLALAIPFASYRVGFCITGAIVIFSVIFCSFLWSLTAWFDNYLIQALYPSLADIPGMGGILGSLTSAYADPSKTNELFVDMIIGTLYVVLPILWMSVMGWAGFQAGQQVTNLVGTMSGTAKTAGERVGNIVTKHLP